MDAAGIADLRDIMKLAPNTYSPSDFGAPSLPDIRGQLGEIFEDGLRQQGGNNGFGIFGATDVFPELTINLMLNVRKRF
jgi:hypothetical protein